MMRLGNFAKNISDKVKARTYGDWLSESNRKLELMPNHMQLYKRRWALSHSPCLFGWI
jgi:hypothetical protein